MLGVPAISCICIAVAFEAKILSVDLNAYSEMKTIKYLSFILETRDLADKSLPVGMSHFYLWESSRHQYHNARYFKECGYFYGVGQQVLIFNACQDTACIQIRID